MKYEVPEGRGVAGAQIKIIVRGLIQLVELQFFTFLDSSFRTSHFRSHLRFNPRSRRQATLCTNWKAGRQPASQPLPAMPAFARGVRFPSDITTPETLSNCPKKTDRDNKKEKSKLLR